MIYLDNAATTWPKPENVYDEVKNTMIKYGANTGRGSHKLSIAASRIVYNTRELLAKFLNARSPMEIIFTMNCTMALNMAIKGLLKTGDHVLITSMEHNSVIRPLNALKSKGINYDIIWCNHEGLLDPENLKKAIKSNTKLIVTTMASNVCGSLMPIDDIAAIARSYGIVYLIDGAQGLGVIDVDTRKMGVDIIAFPGHKGLLGPQGTGGLYISSKLKLDTIIEGGTGSHSDLDSQPEEMPDKFESGTLNAPGIAGLGAGIKYIEERGIEDIRKHEMYLTDCLIRGLREIKGVVVYGPQDLSQRIGVVSINIDDIDSSLVSHILDLKYDIATRSGLHCSILAHKTLGTVNQGTVRFSVGPFNTIDEIENTIKAVYDVAKNFV